MAPFNWLLPLLLTLALPALTFAELWAHYIRFPESVTAPLDDEVVFACQTNNPVERVVWWHRQLLPSGGNPLPWREVKASLGNTRNGDSPYKINAKSALSKLTIQFINENLAGDYMCVSWNGASALASVSGRLAMAWMEDLKYGQNHSITNKIIKVAPGSKVLLRCPPVKSEPPAMIQYYKMIDGVEKELTKNIINGNLIVHAKANSSIYTCAARNPITDHIEPYKQRITVRIDRENTSVPPSFVREMMLDEVIEKEGGTALLGCAVTGIPAPRIFWKRKDGTPISDQLQVNMPYLNFTDLKIQHQGEYVCEASSSAGRAKTTIKLRVRHGARIEPVRPDGVRLQEEETVQEGASVRLHCGRISGEPKPSVYWLINGEEVIHDKKVKILDNELEINPVEKRHAGVVQCFATNILGSEYTASLLRVSPKQFTTQGVVMEGGDRDIPRSIHKVSKTNNGRHRSRLKGGSRKKLFPPSQPNVTRLSDESVMVRWSTPEDTGLRIEFFKVQYKDLNDSEPGRQNAPWNTNDQNLPRDVRSYEVGGLKAGDFYRFRIAAVYSNDDNAIGPTSAKFFLQRSSDILAGPPLAPIFSRAEAVSTTEIRLIWEMEINMDISKETVPVEGFYIYYRLTSSADEYMTESVENKSSRTHVLKKLLPGTQYEIKLQSFNPVAASAFSQIINQGTLKPPSVEKITTPVLGSSNAGGDNNTGQVYGIAGGAVGGAAILVGIIFALLMCKRKRECEPDKPDGNVGGMGSGGPPLEGINGYLPSAPSSKPTITITANPMHAEQNENIGLEMSFYSPQNNNCSTATPRSSIEMPANMPATCREELRKKQSPLPMPLPARENYV